MTGLTQGFREDEMSNDDYVARKDLPKRCITNICGGRGECLHCGASQGVQCRPLAAFKAGTLAKPRARDAMLKAREDTDR